MKLDHMKVQLTLAAYGEPQLGFNSYQAGTRIIVLVKVQNGMYMPFYRSSGENPKPGVARGDWLPFLGLAPSGTWFCKEETRTRLDSKWLEIIGERLKSAYDRGIMRPMVEPDHQLMDWCDWSEQASAWVNSAFPSHTQSYEREDMDKPEVRAWRYKRKRHALVFADIYARLVLEANGIEI